MAICNTIRGTLSHGPGPLKVLSHDSQLRWCRPCRYLVFPHAKIHSMQNLLPAVLFASQRCIIFLCDTYIFFCGRFIPLCDTFTSFLDTHTSLRDIFFDPRTIYGSSQHRCSILITLQLLQVIYFWAILTITVTFLFFVQIPRHTVQNNGNTEMMNNKR